MEDYQHFTAECTDTKVVRDWFISETGLPNKPEVIVQAALDRTPLVPVYGNELYFFSRLYCFKLHYNRARKLGYRPYPGAKIRPVQNIVTSSTESASGTGPSMMSTQPPDGSHGGGDKRSPCQKLEDDPGGGNGGGGDWQGWLSQ